MVRYVWVALALFWSGAAVAAEFTLRFGAISGAANATYRNQIMPMAATWEAESQGRIAVDLRPAGPNGWGRPAEMTQLVDSGKIEVAYTVPGYTPDKFPRLSVIELPFLYQTSVAGTAAMWDLIEAGKIGPDLDKFKVVVLWALPPYGLFATSKSVETIRDLRGLRVRTPSNTVGFALTRLGAVPVGMPLNMMGDTLAGDVIDAVAFGWDSMANTPGQNGKMVSDQVRNLADLGLAAPVVGVLMSRSAYDALPADLKAVIDRTSGRAASLKVAETADVAEALAKDRLRATHKVTSVSADDRRQMIGAVAPAIAQWADGLKKQGVDGAGLYADAVAAVAKAR